MPSSNISPQLHEALVKTLSNGEQVVILYNRRGFSSYLQCESCGEALTCPDCSVTLTYHQKRNRLVCHYCYFTRPAPECCPIRRDPDATRLEAPGESALGALRHVGGGTERVGEEIQELIPDARISRMDRDTVMRKGAYQEILGKMKSGESNVLIGTQMIAKGHDIPGVTLVGIIDADVGIHLPDFRSNERTFQLITQASGRAGRGSIPGRVIIQTREPQHPTLLASANNKFKAFARFELERRQALHYPPFNALMRIVVSSEDLDLAYSSSIRVSQLLSNQDQLSESFVVLGPAPAPMERLRGRFRWHLLIKTEKKSTLSRLARALRTWKDAQKEKQEFRLSLDIDPIDML